jgi:hypothetical protein
MEKSLYEFKFEDKEHKKEFEIYLSEQEYVNFSRSNVDKKFVEFLEEEIKILESIKIRFADLEDDFTQGFGFEEDPIAGSVYVDLDRRIDKLKRLLSGVRNR